MRPQFETGDTVQFTFVSSVAPDANPRFCIYTGSAETLVASMTSATSGATAFYAMVTMPGSAGIYLGEWYTTKTTIGVPYPFVKRMLFNVVHTKWKE
jgi:hypothetical protein